MTMLPAKTVTKLLRGHWDGTRGMCRCPAHIDRTPSLCVRDGINGALLVKCHAGCDQMAVIAKLTELGLWGGWSGHSRTDYHAPCKQGNANTEVARHIWRASQSAAGTLVETYLHARHIEIAPPLSLRFYPALRHPSGDYFPAMVAVIESCDQKFVGILRTFLMPDGTDKANIVEPKLALGSFGDGAVRLAPVGPTLGLAEGIETGLSAMDMFDVPVWVACGSRLDRINLPSHAHHVILFGDNGTAGHIAAEKAARKFEKEGRAVVFQYPSEEFGDWNDVKARRSATLD